ncbi:MAG: hypothetical protein FRX48_08515 [Lasallia pustulata]|uniref:Uncharacterized protein n=1 Tax=Lasallia pustulata TaxID=136370 RepID=A0A5M8PEA2_9LECA|nr:MAG: hypothetical protein FRX48_08515 [Lasallia pustulata]
MSLDAGGLAQMTYNPNFFNNGLGVPTSGFASRGKGSHIKRLSVAPPPNISTINETLQPQPNPTPRTSRSHLLAGLRTAPKSPTFPTSAPPTQLQQHFGLESSRYAGNENLQAGRGMPQTATGASFPSSAYNRYSTSSERQMYSHPEQVLAPPAISVVGEQGDSQMDPNLYAELVATNQYLAQQQMRLQQQLINVTAAAQQFQEMSINNNSNNNFGQQQRYVQSPVMPMTPSMSLYNQQLQNGLQPVIQAMPNQPGLYSVYNPMTGQHGYFMDQSAHQDQYASQAPIPNQDLSHSPPPPTPTFRAQVSPPPESIPTLLSSYRSGTPPKASPSPPQDDVNPLPPPSANAFRRGHKKALSSISGFNSMSSVQSDGFKPGVPKSAGFPQTPMTGTFGPGQARAGEHPIRQPRGPPSLEELIAKPTSKFEGSKNFATRQRRRAVHNLVRAGMERRVASRGSGSVDSAGSMTPSSEKEITFSISSDNDSDSANSRSGSLSGKPSIGSLRAAANGAIGSERKELKERSRERSSVDSSYTSSSISSEESSYIGGKLAEVRVDERRKTPLLVLTNAEKRKSSLF